MQSPYTVRQSQKTIGISQHDQANGWE
jgi:hypothetical protein